ncbi:MAG: sulfatase [Verrucomicrobiota bacterium]
MKRIPIRVSWIVCFFPVLFSNQLLGKEQPNIIFFATDDLSDWISPMGYSQAITPNMDRLARAGVTFQNAHTAGTYCAPSRTAIFSGRHVSTTGCYRGQIYFVADPEIKPLQVALQEAGYKTMGGGKLFHHTFGQIDFRGWDEYFHRDESAKLEGWPLKDWSLDTPFLPQPYPNSVYNQSDRPTKAPWFLEWGPVLNEHEEEMADTKRINWVCQKLMEPQQEPFFLAVGIYAPHFPNYVPQKYFDLYDRDSLVPPDYLETDLDDLPEHVRKAKTARGRIHKHLESIDAVKDAIHGYLASVSYADAMLGRVLDTLAKSPYRGDTILVLWSDHGYHHGQKFDWGKHNLWERTSNVPLLWAGPGIARNQSVDTTVSLIDLYPTLMDLAGIPVDPELDGTSLAGVLADPSTARDRDVLLPGLEPEEYAIINQDWRYIRYANGTEELYDLQNDPNEWNNLAGNPEYDEVKTKLADSAPQTFAPPAYQLNDYRMVTNGETFTWVKKEK